MKGRVKLKMVPKIILSVVVLVLGYILVYARPVNRPINEVDIFIHRNYDQFFLDEEEVRKLMSDKGRTQLEGALSGELELKLLEDRIKEHAFVKSSVVSRNMDGSIFVEVEQKELMARLIRESAKDAYVSEDKELLGVSDVFTARVLLVRGDFADRMIIQQHDTLPERDSLLYLIESIHQNPFLRAQIAELNVDQGGSVVMHPQVGREKIIFGAATDIDEKLRKLKAYYDYVIPAKGWGIYDQINLKYKDQIICE